MLTSPNQSITPLRSTLPYKIKPPLRKGPHKLNGIKFLHEKMLQMRMLLTLNIFFDIIMIIFFHIYPIVPHPKDTLGDGYTIEMTFTNAIIICVNGNELISKLKKTQHDTII